jgi:pyruvate dehydrogenase E2 component (dihydrolipoamide acetyltransferase)
VIPGLSSKHCFRTASERNTMHEIRIPRLGWSMDDGVFVRWLKQPGERIAVGDPLFELEGDKALQEIEAVDAGILYVPQGAPQPGSVAAVGMLLGYLLSPGEAIPIEQTDDESTQVAQRAVRPESTMSASSASRSGAEHLTAIAIATPRAKRVAKELGVNWLTLRGTGRDGRIREADVRASRSDMKGP